MRFVGRAAVRQAMTTRVGRSLLGSPEVFIEDRSQNRNVDGEDADDGFAHAPAVDADGRGVAGCCQNHADDGSGDHECSRG